MSHDRQQERVVPVSVKMGKRRVLSLEAAFPHFHTSTTGHCWGPPRCLRCQKGAQFLPVEVGDAPQPLATWPNLEFPSFILLEFPALNKIHGHLLVSWNVGFREVLCSIFLGLPNAWCIVKAGFFFSEKLFFSRSTFGSRGRIEIKKKKKKSPYRRMLSVFGKGCTSGVKLDKPWKLCPAASLSKC